MNLTSWLIIVGAVIVVLALIILVLALRYRKVGPNEALIIAGGRKHTITLADGTKQKVGYRYRLGGGVFVWPGMEKVYVLPMDIIPVSIRTPEVLTSGGVPIMAEASAQIKIGSSDEAIHLAAEQFLGIGREGVRDVAVNVLEGKVREVIGGMSVEEIYRGRQEFSSRVVKAVQADFAKMGLAMLSFALKDISDTQGYIDSLSKPQIAAAKRDAAIAQAETEKESIIKSSQARKEAEVARLQSEALIAKAQWENEAKKAESQVVVNTKKAQADFSYELERNRIGQDLKKEEAKVKQVEKEEAIKIEQLEIARKEKELEATVIKPADARKYQIKSEAEAEEYPDRRRGQGQVRGRQARGPGRSRRDPGQGLRRSRVHDEEGPGVGKVHPGRRHGHLHQGPARAGQGGLGAPVEGRQDRHRRRRQGARHDQDHGPGGPGPGPDARGGQVADGRRHPGVPQGQALPRGQRREEVSARPGVEAGEP